MAEPRSRPRRPNHNPGNHAANSTSTSSNSTTPTTFPTTDLSDLLYAFASSPPHLPTTISTLDEILTDFVIETCHLAALSASYSRRAKLKVEDFKFVLRHDERLLGRAMEQIWRDKRIKENRRVAGMMDEGGGGAAGLEAAAMEGGVEGSELKGGGAKRGRKKKRKREEGEEGVGEQEAKSGKRVAS